MRKSKSRIILIAIIVLLIVCMTVAADASKNKKQYKIAYTSVRMSFPDSWVCCDKTIQDGDPMCDIMGTDARGIAEAFLNDNRFFLAFEQGTRFIMSLSVFDTDMYNFDELKDENIKYFYDARYKETADDKDGSLVYSCMSVFDEKFYFSIEKPSMKDASVCYYYKTIKDSKEYVFFFVTQDPDIEAGKNTFDDIMKSVVISPSAPGKEDKSDLLVSEDGRLRMDDFFLLTRKEYVYTTRSDKNLDYTEQFVFEHDEHCQALVSFDGFYAEVISHPRQHKNALTDTECLDEIIHYANGGFGYLSKKITVESLGNYCYLIMGKDDMYDDVNVEFLYMYIFHESGIVEINTNHTFVNDIQREKCISYIKDLANCVIPLRPMPSR